MGRGIFVKLFKSLCLGGGKIRNKRKNDFQVH